MRYPVIIHKEPATDYGVIVPDFPGVFSGGDTPEEALDNVQEAIEARYGDEEGFEPPAPSPLGEVMASPDAQGGAVAMAEISFTFLKKNPARRPPWPMPAGLNGLFPERSPL